MAFKAWLSYTDLKLVQLLDTPKISEEEEQDSFEDSQE
jgi:hypothetical protein